MVEVVVEVVVERAAGGSNARDRRLEVVDRGAERLDSGVTSPLRRPPRSKVIILFW